jgi:prevent-host-death family protein
MSEGIGVVELRRNLGVYVRRVCEGERLLITSRGRPVAELGPLQSAGGDEPLIEEATCRLSEIAPDAEVVVFGPRARGNAFDDSELDLVVIGARLRSSGNGGRSSPKGASWT